MFNLLSGEYSVFRIARADFSRRRAAQRFFLALLRADRYTGKKRRK
jgi:hypothetical protein